MGPKEGMREAGGTLSTVPSIRSSCPSTAAARTQISPANGRRPPPHPSSLWRSPVQSRQPPRPLFILPRPAFIQTQAWLAGGDREFIVHGRTSNSFIQHRRPEVASMQSEGYFSKVGWWGHLRCIGNKFARGSIFLWCCMDERYVHGG